MHSYENRGSGAASSPPAEPAGLDLAEAASWTGNWSHLIAAWLFGAVVLARLVVFIMHFGAIEVFVAKLRGANPLWLAAALLPIRDLSQRSRCLVPCPQAGRVAAAVPEPAQACVR
jgi:hypothetical protein